MKEGARGKEQGARGGKHSAESIGHRAAKGKVHIAKKPRVTVAGLDTDAAGLVSSPPARGI